MVHASPGTHSRLYCYFTIHDYYSWGANAQLNSFAFKKIAFRPKKTRKLAF